MSIEQSNRFGTINISQDAIAMLAGGTVTECYGVVGMASQKLLKDGFAELLNIQNFSKGVVVRKNDHGLEIDLYIIVMYGTRVSEVVTGVQEKVKYVLEKSLGYDITSVNVTVQGVKVVN